jgi:hypothetical protein
LAASENTRSASGRSRNLPSQEESSSKVALCAEGCIKARNDRYPSSERSLMLDAVIWAPRKSPWSTAWKAAV